LQFAGTITTHDGETDPILRALFPIGGSASWLLTNFAMIIGTGSLTPPDPPTNVRVIR
jgi:hypothetical protein